MGRHKTYKDKTEQELSRIRQTRYNVTDKGRSVQKAYRDRKIADGSLAKAARVRRAQSPQACMTSRLRARLNSALKGKLKADSTMKLVGLTSTELMQYIESKFKPGMSWGNRKEWHIDHIKPCSSFNLTSSIQQKDCFHYTNLQLLWRIDNLKKGKRYEQILVLPAVVSL